MGHHVAPQPAAVHPVHDDGRLQSCFGMLVTHANDAPISRLQEWGRQSGEPTYERLWSRCTTLKLQLRPEEEKDAPPLN